MGRMVHNHNGRIRGASSINRKDLLGCPHQFLAWNVPCGKV